MSSGNPGKRALVTGGAGFVGSHLVDRLVREGFSVMVVDNLATGRQQNVNTNAQLYVTDIAGPGLAEVFAQVKPHVVFHLAAQASVTRSMAQPMDDAVTNVVGAVNLLDQCRQHGIDRFIYSSTGGALYGEPETLPCLEDHPIKPLSVYGASKYAVESYLRVFSQQAGFPYTILRVGNIYGPRQDPHGEAGVIAIFAHRMLEGKEVVIYGDGEQERDFVYVSDVIDANMRALEQDTGRSDIYNIGTGQGTSVNVVFAHLAEATDYARAPVYTPARPGEVHRIYLDTTKAHDGLGWTPTVRLPEGVERTVKELGPPQASGC